MLRKTFAIRSLAAIAALLTAAVMFIGAPLTAEAQSEQDLTVGQRVFYWFPNRILDAVDIVQFGVAFGPGLGAEVAVTEAFQIGGYRSNDDGAEQGKRICALRIGQLRVGLRYLGR